MQLEPARAGWLVSWLAGQTYIHPLEMVLMFVKISMQATLAHAT